MPATPPLSERLPLPPSHARHRRLWVWFLRPRGGSVAGATALTLLAGLGDYITGADLAFTLFYLVPITYATWKTGTTAGAALALLSAALWLGIAVATGAHRGHPWLIGWNLLVQVVIFFSFAVLLGLLRQHIDAEAQEKRIAVEQLRHAERLNTVGKLAAGLAHELGTPLNVISGRTELLQSGRLAPADAKHSLQVILEQTQRMSSILRQLLDFARRGGDHKTTVALGDMVLQTVDLLRPMAAKRGTELVAEPPAAPVRVLANAAEIQQVLTNLVLNALQASPRGGRVRLDVRLTAGMTLDQPPEAIIQVEDQGSGIEPEHLSQIFDPFFTTKPVGEGTGLGLSVSYGIIRDHGGRIEVESSPGHGSRFRVHLPAVD